MWDFTECSAYLTYVILIILTAILQHRAELLSQYSRCGWRLSCGRTTCSVSMASPQNLAVTPSLQNTATWARFPAEKYWAKGVWPFLHPLPPTLTFANPTWFFSPSRGRETLLCMCEREWKVIDRLLEEGKVADEDQILLSIPLCQEKATAKFWRHIVEGGLHSSTLKEFSKLFQV